jgi:hypothetical protein
LLAAIIGQSALQLLCTLVVMENPSQSIEIEDFTCMILSACILVADRFGSRIYHIH